MIWISLQVSLRWVYEQGVSMVVKSFQKERLEENIKLFDWKLSDEECQKICEIPQCKKISIQALLFLKESSKSHDLSDVDIIEE